MTIYQDWEDGKPFIHWHKLAPHLDESILIQYMTETMPKPPQFHSQPNRASQIDTSNGHMRNQINTNQMKLNKIQYTTKRK